MWKVKCGKKFRLKYVKKVSCFNKAKIYYNDENDFTVVSRDTDSDCESSSLPNNHLSLTHILKSPPPPPPPPLLLPLLILIRICLQT